jgi:vacuolar-type H+-ATPase subunit I/STV1
MKSLLKIAFLSLLLFASLFAQKDKWQDDNMREKFEELEKIKIIETLQMDEETTLRFFSRQSEHKNEQREIMDEIKQDIDDLDAMLKSGRPVTTEELKKKISDINDLELKLDQNRVAFINSLSDILSYEQIAQLIIFERTFRNEVRKMIMKDRRPPKNQD